MTREEAVKRFETLLLHIDTDCVMGMETTEAINMAIKALEQPEPCEDAVSKADVLETYADLYDVFEDNKQICKELHKVYDKLNALPSAQPEIVRCKDCKEFRRWIDTDITFCDLTESERGALDFCSRAERREEGGE